MSTNTRQKRDEARARDRAFHQARIEKVRYIPTLKDRAHNLEFRLHEERLMLRLSRQALVIAEKELARLQILIPRLLAVIPEREKYIASLKASCNTLQPQLEREVHIGKLQANIRRLQRQIREEERKNA